MLYRDGVRQRSVIVDYQPGRGLGRPGLFSILFLSAGRGKMKPSGLTIEDLLPHRGGMMLIDEVMEVDEKRAVAASVVSSRWPLFDGMSVSPIVLIELIAQTAGLSNGLERLRRHGRDSEKRGWLMGIKRSLFFIDAIPLKTRIVTRCENRFEYDSFREIVGTAEIGGDIVCEASLQVFQSDSDESASMDGTNRP
jgi:predicted hotdog family 3-hydroxylacyl-ACP dehydratase